MRWRNRRNRETQAATARIELLSPDSRPTDAVRAFASFEARPGLKFPGRLEDVLKTNTLHDDVGRLSRDSESYVWLVR
jgi:hypothetical protein